MEWKAETMRLRARALAGLLACAAGASALFGSPPAAAQQDAELTKPYAGMKWRLIGPYRGGRVLAVSGIPGDPRVYYFGAVAGGGWKTTDAPSTRPPLFHQHPLPSLPP